MNFNKKPTGFERVGLSGWAHAGSGGSLLTAGARPRGSGRGLFGSDFEGGFDAAVFQQALETVELIADRSKQGRKIVAAQAGAGCAAFGQDRQRFNVFIQVDDDQVGVDALLTLGLRGQLKCEMN
ncbi:MAG: hypothetical protein H6974_11095 [Gammaproteobacteria bacterium]|nr:hypothetical protein [Gammaproteobacteria bacterium]